MENNQPIRVNFQALETKLIPLDAVVLYRNISRQYRHGVVLAGIFSHPSTQFEADLCLYFIRSIIEACLFAEIEYQLRLDFKSTGNKRNGYTRRTFNTAFGPLEIQVPRARQCTFEAKILVPFKRQLSNDFIEAVLGLYPRYKEIEQIKLQLLKVYSEQFHQTAPFNEIAEAVVIEILKWRMIRSMFAYVDAQLPNVRTGNRFIDGTSEEYRNAFSHVFQNRQVSPPEAGGQPEAAPEAFDNYQPGYESYPEAYPQGYNGHQYPQYPQTQPPYPQNYQGRYQEYPPQYDNQYYDNYGQPYNEYSQEGYDYRQYDQYDPAYGQYDQAYEKYDQYGNPVGAHPNPAHNRQRAQGHYYGYEQGSQYDPAYDRRYSQHPQPAPQPTPRSNHPAPQGAPARYPRESHQPEPHPRRHPRPATPYDSPYAEAPESYASKPFDPAAELEAGFAEAGFSYQQPSKSANLAAKNADAADKAADKATDKAADKSDAAVLEEQVPKQAQVGLAADAEAPVAKGGSDLAEAEAQVSKGAQTQVVAETVQATDDDGYGNEDEVFNEKLLD